MILSKYRNLLSYLSANKLAKNSALPDFFNVSSFKLRRRFVLLLNRLAVTGLATIELISEELALGVISRLRLVQELLKALLDA